MNELIIYTDGCCKGNHKSGVERLAGWSNVILDKDENILGHNGSFIGTEEVDNVTNNSAELLAILNALKVAFNSKTNTTIVSDSEYAINAVNDHINLAYGLSQMLSGKYNANLDILSEIQDTLYNLSEANIKVSLKHVPGHQGVPMNELADKIAKVYSTGNTYTEIKVFDPKMTQIDNSNGIANDVVGYTSNGRQYIKYRNVCIYVDECYSTHLSTIESMKKVGIKLMTREKIESIFKLIISSVQHLNVVPEIVSYYDMVRVVQGKLDVNKLLAYCAYFAKTHVLGKSGVCSKLKSKVILFKVYYNFGYSYRNLEVSTEKFTGKVTSEQLGFNFMYDFNVEFTQYELIQLNFESSNSNDYKQAIAKISNELRNR